MKTNPRTALQTLQRLAALSLTALLVNYAATAQDHAGRPAPLAAEAAAPAFEAAVFPSRDPLILKVVFRNPTREPLTLLVRNEHAAVIYRQPLRNVRSYNSDFHLAGLADGNYQVEIAGKSVRYAKSLRVTTKVVRLAEAR
jgi:hypothetical protein